MADAGETLRREDAVLLLVDFQEKLLPVISSNDSVVAAAAKAARFAQIVSIPVVMTEQEKIGATVRAVLDCRGDAEPFRKITFDCFGCEPFASYLESLGRKTLVLAGIETHVCVLQTALTALRRKWNVHVLADAVSSRTVENRALALERMRAAGAVVSSTEMFIFETLERAGTDEFREALKLVK